MGTHSSPVIVSGFLWFSTAALEVREVWRRPRRRCSNGGTPERRLPFGDLLGVAGVDVLESGKKPNVTSGERLLLPIGVEKYQERCCLGLLRL